VDDERHRAGGRAQHLVEYVAHLPVVAHHHADHVGQACQLGDAGCDLGPGGLELDKRRRSHVVHDQVEGGGGQPERHRLPDVAQPDEADGRPHARNVPPPSTAMI
jgi:hypothetical protein